MFLNCKLWGTFISAVLFKKKWHVSLTKRNGQWSPAASKLASHSACTSSAALCKWSCSLLEQLMCPRRLLVKGWGELPQWVKMGVGTCQNRGPAPPPQNEVPFWVKFCFNYCDLSSHLMAHIIDTVYRAVLSSSVPHDRWNDQSQIT